MFHKTTIQLTSDLTHNIFLNHSPLHKIYQLISFSPFNNMLKFNGPPYSIPCENIRNYKKLNYLQLIYYKLIQKFQIC